MWLVCVFGQCDAPVYAIFAWLGSMPLREYAAQSPFSKAVIYLASAVILSRQFSTGPSMSRRTLSPIAPGAL